jgi:uncharacterized repeat protein (TIGR01451 family)
MKFWRLLKIFCTAKGALLRLSRACLSTLLFLLASQPVSAQVVYGIGDPVGGAALFNTFYIVNPNTGVATLPSVPSTLPAGVTESVAIGVSPINGLVYWVERAVATPRFGTWSPATGATSIVGNAATPAGITSFLRATFCPNGRFYIAANGSAGGAGAEIYEINPSNGALIRTLVVTNLPINGSGDIVCLSNGDMYMAAQSTTPSAATGPYVLYRATQGQIGTGGTFAATFVGNIGTSTQAINGLSERPDGQIIASAAFNVSATYVIATSTGVATTLTTAAGVSLADLSREFPRDVSVSKTATPTAALQGKFVQYTVLATNSGPAVAGSVTIADTLNSTAYDLTSVTWTCSVLSAGSATAVTTACGAASGTGNISTYANLSINSAVQYVITAPLRSSFTGTVTNSVSATLTGTTVDVNPSNNSTTVTSTVSPAATLTIAKTNGVGTLTAGQTTSYTITVANLGPASVTNAVLSDPAVAGLSCLPTVTCAVASGTATCPTAPISLASVQTGLPIPSLGVNSSMTFVLTCAVTATGQ